MGTRYHYGCHIDLHDVILHGKIKILAYWPGQASSVDGMPVTEEHHDVVAFCLETSQPGRLMTTNKQKADLVRDAVDNAGTSLDDHYKAREVIIGNLIQTKIPIVKICDKHIRVDENDKTPYELSEEAKEIFRGIADAIESSNQADLSDTADDLALSHDIKLLP